jgi:transposase
MQVSTIGWDIAKIVFQVHGIDGDGRTVLCRKIRRERLIEMLEGVEPCLTGPLRRIQVEC